MGDGFNMASDAIGRAPSCFKQHQVFHEFYRQKPMGSEIQLDGLICLIAPSVLWWWRFGLDPNCFKRRAFLHLSKWPWCSFQVPDLISKNDLRVFNFRIFHDFPYFFPPKNIKNHCFSPFFPKKNMVFLHFSPKNNGSSPFFPKKTWFFSILSPAFPGLFHRHWPRPGASLSPGRTAQPARRGRWPGRRCRFCRTSKRKADEKILVDLKDWASVNSEWF